MRWQVALRKESVDRNYKSGEWPTTVARSLSARRAWIEIIKLGSSATMGGTSLSARRAWIEIIDEIQLEFNSLGRSPQGERG